MAPPLNAAASAQHEIDESAHPHRELLFDRVDTDAHLFGGFACREALEFAEPDDFATSRWKRIQSLLCPPQFVTRVEMPLGTKQIDVPVNVFEIRNQLERYDARALCSVDQMISRYSENIMRTLLGEAFPGAR